MKSFFKLVTHHRIQIGDDAAQVLGCLLHVLNLAAHKIVANLELLIHLWSVGVESTKMLEPVAQVINLTAQAPCFFRRKHRLIRRLSDLRSPAYLTAFGWAPCGVNTFMAPNDHLNRIGGLLLALE